MTNPTNVGLVGVLVEREVSTPILRRSDPSLNIIQCAECGEHFKQRVNWETWCDQCRRYEQLYRALKAYAAVNKRPSSMEDVE